LLGSGLTYSGVKNFLEFYRMIRPTSKRMALLFTLLLCSVSMYVYWSHLRRNWGGSPEPQARALRTDLFAQWYGARELLLHHRDPYSDDVTREVQIGYYGQQLDPSKAGDISHQQRFAYPLYVVFFLAPTVNLQYRTVEIIFLVLLAIVSALSIPLWGRSIELSLSASPWLLLMVICSTSIPYLQAFDLLQLALLVAAFLAAAAASAASGHLFLAGAFLALSTIKPQLSFLPIAWFLLWVVSGWRERRTLLGGFVVMMGALILSSEWLMPSWLLRFPAVLMAYEKHTKAPSLLGALLPGPLRWLAAIIVIVAAAPLCRRALSRPAGSFSFALALASSLTLSTLLVPAVFQPFNYVVLMPVLLLVIRYWSDLFLGSRLARFGAYSCCALALLPWPLAVAVALGQLLPSLAWLQKAWFAPLNASLGLPFAAFGFVMLLSMTENRRSL